jgi:hypothetical protein
VSVLLLLLLLLVLLVWVKMLLVMMLMLLHVDCRAWMPVVSWRKQKLEEVLDLPNCTDGTKRELAMLKMKK